MCLDCGCLEPDNPHDGRHITLAGLSAAATDSGITLQQAALNILATVQACCAGMLPDDVAKDAVPQRYVLGIAYQAGRNPLISKGQDGGRDFLTAEEIEKSAWEFLSSGPRVGLFHLDGTETGIDGEATATVVESYIWRGPDWDLGDGIVAKSGDWLLGAVLSPKAWEMQQRGQITGWSPQGVARRRKFNPAGGVQ